MRVNREPKGTRGWRSVRASVCTRHVCTGSVWKNVRFNRGGGEGGGEKESLFFFFVDIDGSAKARLEI